MPPTNRKRRRSSSSELPTISNDETHTEGDCTIISAGVNEVRFRVQSKALLDASSVFKDMYAICSGPLLIQMSDPDIEGAESIKLWLNSIDGHPPALDSTIFHKASQILRLARKYDCGSLCRSTINLVQRAQAVHCTAINVRDIIILTASFDQTEMVADAIRRGESFSTMFRAYGQEVDPSAWSFEDWQRLPGEYAWAISRACKRVRTRNNQAERFLFEMQILNGAKRRKHNSK